MTLTESLEAGKKALIDHEWCQGAFATRPTTEEEKRLEVEHARERGIDLLEPAQFLPVRSGDPLATAFCIQATLSRAEIDSPLIYSFGALKALRDAIGVRGDVWLEVAYWNDAVAKTKEDCIALFDKAIEMAKDSQV